MPSGASAGGGGGGGGGGAGGGGGRSRSKTFEEYEKDTTDAWDDNEEEEEDISALSLPSGLQNELKHQQQGAMSDSGTPGGRRRVGKGKGE